MPDETINPDDTIGSQPQIETPPKGEPPAEGQPATVDNPAPPLEAEQKAIGQAKADQPEPKPSVEPEPTAGKQVFDNSSHRLTELFESGDVVFVREGAATHLTAYPRHEADTRFMGVDKVNSTFRDSRTVSEIDLVNGDRVTIDGITVIYQPKEGPAELESPDLNAHAPNETH